MRAGTPLKVGCACGVTPSACRERPFALEAGTTNHEGSRPVMDKGETALREEPIPLGTLFRAPETPPRQGGVQQNTCRSSKKPRRFT